MLEPPSRRWLLNEARRALEAALLGRATTPATVRPDDPALSHASRVFVSWHLETQLVGCIGSLEPRQTLEDAVRHLSVQAGLHDPRTPPAEPDRLPHMRCEISVLSPPVPHGELGLRSIERALVPGRDGLILAVGERRAVFLPVVWERLPEPAQFVRALCHKAGIDPETRGPDARGWIFATETFGE